jgi:pimeloyl-ACP methyl ester carboxylesterase
MKNRKRFLSLLLGACVALSSLSAALPDPVHQDKTVNKDVVVLLHGLGRSKTAMWLLASRLQDAGFLVERIGYRSLTQSPDEIVTDVSRKIDACCAGHRQNVHFGGHSLGGLLIRAYLQEHRVENLGRVVLIGTPNQGTALVDNFRGNWLFQLLGPTTAALGTDGASLPNRLSEPYYPVGVIAGVNDSGRNDHLLPGRDDGLVPVESTKLEGMSDFTEVESGHSMMRYDNKVARQVVAFLKRGKFLHKDGERSDGAFPDSEARSM